MSRVAVVAIGRNEGERLRVCLESVVGRVDTVVYVDSGSTDDSVAMAKSLGAEVVELDMTQPFTAARARNAGFTRVEAVAPLTDYVQFIDGDCELAEEWIDQAVATLEDHGDAAAVWGGLQERFPERSIYNRLCNVEWQWDLPFGEVESFGGITLMRTKAFREVGGYTDRLIAGEERDLAVKLRQAGWTIHRIDALMARHDAAILRFGQFWRRSVRTGHAYAQGHWRSGREMGTWVSEVRSIKRWGVIVPLTALVFALPTLGLSLLLIVLYPLQTARLYRYMRRRGFGNRDAAVYAVLTVFGKIPNGLGLLKFHWERLRGKEPGLIEYK